MTAYVMTGSGSLRDIGTAGIFGVVTARTGGDTFNTNGFNLLIDQDVRYGLSGTTSATLGNITVNASKGGNLNIDGRYVRLIPFTGGSGTITAGTLITCGSATAKVIGLYSAMTAAPVLTGVATGWIKVTEWNGIAFPTSGAFTQAGYTFTISGADKVGFIEINGDDASTIYANRLGSVNITGEWYSLGTTSGVSNQTLQIPNNGVARYAAGVFIEKTGGLKDYEFYPNNGANVATGTDVTRGKVVWIDATGLVRIGNSGAATNGHTPASGLEVVVPNIFFECNTTAARTANVIPNATIATRYDFTATGGGVVNIDKGNFAWYGSFSQAYSVNISNSGFIDGILLSEVATPMTFSKVGVGNKPTTALLMSPLTMTLCFAGGTFTDCVWLRASMAASGAHTNTLTDIAGFTFVRDTVRAGVIRGNATTYSINATRANNCTWTAPTIIQGAATFTTCNGITFTNTTYCETVSATTITTYAGSVWTIASNSLNCTFSGLTMPVLNNQPYTALLQISAAGCDNTKLRNIGTRSTPLSMGTVNACSLIYSLAGAAAATNTKVQRVYCSGTRTGIMTGDNSSKGLLQEQVFGDYADAADVAAVLEYQRKGIGGTLAVTAQTAIYGTHWFDCFTSTTAGRIGLLMNEATTNTSTQVSLANGAGFTSAGGLYMPTIGMTATFETPGYVLGHTQISATAGTMAGGTVGNYRFEYSIDKNDGAGWSAMTSAAYTAATLATALNGVGALNAALGFKLRLKISTTTGNTTAITSFFIPTVSTTTAQDYQYPLDTVTLTISGLVTGSDVVIRAAGTSTVLASVDANVGGVWAYVYETPEAVDIDVLKPGYVPYPLVRNYMLSSSNSSLPCSQLADRNYQ